MDKLDAIDAAFADGSADPYALKRELAANICDLYHGEGAGAAASDAFDAQFKRAEAPEDMPEFPLSVAEVNDEGKVYLGKLLVEVGIAKSAGEARRLVDGGGVKINGEAVAPSATTSRRRSSRRARRSSPARSAGRAWCRAQDRRCAGGVAAAAPPVSVSL